MGYAWYLSIWMRVFHGSEGEFWKRMNPRRMGQLLATLEKPKAPEKRIQSLSQYMAGGE